MRKYLATDVQVFGMPEKEVQEVARHMGHELSVHKKFYRLQDDVIELAKISKLLLAVESGKAHLFKGVSLDDLDFNDIPEEGDDEESMDLTSVTEIPVEYDGYESDTNQLTLQDSAPVSICQGVKQSHTSDFHVSSRTSTDTDASKKSLLANADCDVANVSNNGVQQPGNGAPAADSFNGANVSNNAVQQPGNGAHATDSRKQPVRLKSKQSENQPKDQYNIEDPDYKDDQADSSDSDSSDSDGEPAVKKRKRNSKKKWTDEEKAALKPLVLKAFREKKPPTKCDITKLLKNSIVTGMPW